MMKKNRIRKTLLSGLALALLAVNGMFLFPKEAQAFVELERADCYWTWDLTGFTQKSFIKCDGCTRVEAYNPSDDRRCSPSVE